MTINPAVWIAAAAIWLLVAYGLLSENTFKPKGWLATLAILFWPVSLVISFLVFFVGGFLGVLWAFFFAPRQPGSDYEKPEIKEGRRDH